MQNENKPDFSALLELPDHILTNKAKDALMNGQIDLSDLDVFVVKLSELNAESEWNIELLKNDMFGDVLILRKNDIKFEKLLGIRIPEKDINNERHRAEFMIDATRNILKSIHEMVEIYEIAFGDGLTEWKSDARQDFIKFGNFMNRTKINVQDMYDSLWEYVNRIGSTDKFISKRKLGCHLSEFDK